VGTHSSHDNGNRDNRHDEERVLNTGLFHPYPADTLQGQDGRGPGNTIDPSLGNELQ
jgi:hypothetical protein